MLSKALTTAAAGSAGGGDYQISRSLRFNSADSAYLSRTPASAGNRKTWTWSGWVKRGLVDANYRTIFCGYSSGSVLDYLIFFNDFTLGFRNYNGSSYDLLTTQVFRDPSSWYHIVLAVDSTQATSTNRVKIYVNGSQITAFGTATYPSQNYDFEINNNVSQYLGYNGFNYIDGYLTEINFIDGQALTPSSFGETNETTGVWSPIRYAGSYGTNGFYLNFSDNTSTTTLGEDQAGSNDWTLNNFSVTAGAGNDSLVDTPTQYGTDTGAGGQVRGNYATFNPTAVSGMGLATLANGNLDSSGAINIYVGAVSTIAMSSGKWYWEHTLTGIGQTSGNGIVASTSLASAVAGSYGYATATDCWWRASNGVVYNNSAGAVSSLATFSANDVMNIAVDFDAGKLWFGKNGTWDSSGNPATGANPTITFSPGGKSFYAMVQGYTNSAAWTNVSNFGQRPFAYTAPSGFKALVTTNLPEPTVVQGDNYFNTVLYTGDGAASRSITGVGFQPDWVWVKTRSVADNHNVFDAVRGPQKRLFSNLTNAEDLTSGTLTSFDSDGFSLGSNPDMNTNGVTLVAWNWKANGAGVSNTAGTITSTVSANTIAGISIVTFTGNSVAGATVGHGLGIAPAMIIMKNRAAIDSWQVYHKSLPSAAYRLQLNGIGATDIENTVWNSTAPTSTVFSVGTNVGNFTQVAYCFAEVEGFSKFGSYTGNGSADGPFVYTGFRPAWVMFKRTDVGADWVIEDVTRSPTNQMDARLFANTDEAESSNGNGNIDYLSNGFKLRNSHTSMNTSGGTYIYMAFAENPFKYSLAR